MLNFLMDIPPRVYRRVRGNSVDYRACLFSEVVDMLGDRKVARILEVGPRDGADTRRLLTLEPDALVLVDLPSKEARVRAWLAEMGSDRVEFIVGNLMYSDEIAALEPFDLVWCAGVLYHNPEQLRMLRHLYDLVRPGGLLVIESATVRRRGLRDENCVEIWHNVDKVTHVRHHLSVNVTHVPSRRAIASWLEMVGFDVVLESRCHRQVGRALAQARAAFIARRSGEGEGGSYYTHTQGNYPIARSR
jgi:SAM-dependent methyltransferase